MGRRSGLSIGGGATSGLPSGLTNGAVVWNGSAWVSQLIVDANVATGAAIAKTKIAGTALVIGDAPTAHEATHIPGGSDAIDWKQLVSTPRPETDPLFPTFVANAKVASMQRILATNNVNPLASGRVTFTMMPVWPGLVISKITFIAGSTAAGTPTHQWFELVDPATLTILAVTSDDTTTAWALNTAKTLTLSAPYTVPAGVYAIYAGVMVAASSVPTIIGSGGALSTIISSTSGFAPQLVGNSGAGLTTPPTVGGTASSLGPGATPLYCILS